MNAAGSAATRNGTFVRTATSSSRTGAFETLGSYQLLKRVAGGGMADLYAARARLGRGVDKLVALKMVLPAFGQQTRLRDMFLEEARISATLDHPNVAKVFDFGEADGRPYLAMEYVPGRDLSAILQTLRQNKRIAPVGFSLRVVMEVCRALEYVHGKRDLDGRPLHLVHRDVSPGNVILSPWSEVKLVDFGVATVGGEAVTDGTVVGKLRYLTADQARGLPAEAHWDLFSLGVVLYELLTLRRPYRVNDLEALLTGNVEDRRRRPSELNRKVPPALDAIVLKATERDPARRFQTARELREALAEVAGLVPAFETGRVLARLYGTVLGRESGELERLMSEARAHDRRGLRGWLRSLGHAGARLRGTDGWRRHRRLVVGGLAAAALAGAGSGWVAWSSARETSALHETLSSVDRLVQDGRLVGPGEDALERLLEARRRWPDAPEVRRRLELLARTYESLGRRALARGDLSEAAVQLQIALEADPSRSELAKVLEDIERRVREASRARAAKGAGEG